MSDEQHAIMLMRAMYGVMPAPERITKIHAFVRQSPARNKDFIKNNFPNWFKEAYPHD